MRIVGVKQKKQLNRLMTMVGEIDHLSEEDLSPSDTSDIDKDQNTSSIIFISRN